MIMLARGQIDREELAPARNKDATIIRQLASGRRRPHGIDLECANIIAKLSEQVSLDAGDIIMTGTPAGVAALSPGDKIECGVDGIGTLKVAIGKAA